MKTFAKAAFGEYGDASFELGQQLLVSGVRHVAAQRKKAGFSVRLRKKRGGFGMSISDDTAEVLKLLQEQDGSDGPAAEQGVRIGVYVVAVVRSCLLRSAE